MKLSDLNEIMYRLFAINSDDLNDEISMQTTDKWDSLNHMRLISEIEEKFDLELEMDHIIEMVSVGNIKRILSQQYDIQ